MKFKIVCDSSCDLNKDYIIDKDVGFDIVPLSINIDSENFIDNELLNINDMLNKVKKSSSPGKSACPAPGLFKEAYLGADYVFVVTISSKLSGSFNSAYLGSVETSNMVHVIDSKGTSGMLVLIVDKLYDLIKQGLSFEEIKAKIDDYQKTINLFFVLDKFDNLVKNGRMSKLAAIVATTLFIKPLCIADDGQISIYEKHRTMKSSLIKLVNNIKDKCNDYSGKCIISYCLNEENANFVKRLILEKYNFKEVVVIPMKGLCSFYALENGIIVSF